MRQLTILLCLLCTTLARADDKSHLAAAEKLVEVTDLPTSIKAGFKSTIQPMLSAMRSQGAPESALLEMEQVINKWFDAEIKWPELKPKIVEVYRNKFTEAELKEIVAFYNTPTGKKALQQMPGVLKDTAEIGNKYAMSKQASLMAQLQPIMQKYKSKQ